MKEKFFAKSVKIAEETDRIKELAEKIGIILPSSHTALLQAIYAPINSANLNGIRLAKHAVEKALPGLISAQANMEHFGKNWMIGIILSAFINDNNEIEIIFSFAKNLFPEEYERAIELIQSGDLSTSFELLAETDDQEHLADGTVLLNSIDFQGVGLLLDNPPAYPGAKVHSYAKLIKERLSHIDDKELICASVIKTCDKILSEQHPDEITEEPILWTTVTSRVDRHIHVIKIDLDGNGESKGTFGDNEEPHIHQIANFQIQLKAGHAHRILEELLAKRKEEIKAIKWGTETNNFPNDSFAIIEPAFLNGETANRKARHLPFKDRNGRFDLTNYRIALDKVNRISPVTDSITTEELREKAKEELDKHNPNITEKTDGGSHIIFPKDHPKVKDNKDHFPISDVNQARNALARVAQFDSVPSWYDGTLSELVKAVKNAVRKNFPSIEVSINSKTQGGVKLMTQAEKETIKALREELGDFAKDVKDEDLLDKTVVAELRKEKEATKADENKEGDSKADSKDDKDSNDEAKVDANKNQEKSDSEKAQDRIKELEGKIEELENTLEAKDSEIETVRENAETIGKTKVQLKDNKFAKDFKDEDYLDDEKVEKAIQDQKDSETVAKRKEELKDNKYATDFKDEDYLNDDKVELVKVKQEKDTLESKKDKVDASKNIDEEDMETGDTSKGSYKEVIASIRKNRNENSKKQKIYTR